MDLTNPDNYVTAGQLADIATAARDYTNTKAASTADEKINALDAEVTSADGTNVQVKVTEADGKITAVNIATDNTVNATDVANAIKELDANVTSNNGTNVQVQVVETDGKVTAVSITDDTVNATDVANAISSALANYGGFQVVPLGDDDKPDVSDPSERFIYLTRDDTTPEPDHYTEWIWIAAAGAVAAHWEVMGETTVDLSNYYKKTESDARYLLLSKLGSHMYTIPTDTPSYNYSILANFVPGHTVGTIVEGSWIETVQSFNDCVEEWILNYNSTEADYAIYKAHMVDGTVGERTVDNRTPVDFSAYGIATGTPYGMSTNNTDVGTTVKYSISSQLKSEMTAEFWAFAIPEDPSEGYNTHGSLALLRIGNQVGGEPDYLELLNLTLYVDSAYEPDYGIHLAFLYNEGFSREFQLAHLSPSDLSTLFGEQIDFKKWLTDWHHYAISIDSSFLYLFIDGKKAVQVALTSSGTVTSYEGVSTTGTVSELLALTDNVIGIKGTTEYEGKVWNGGYAQFAVCDACKWTADFTVPTTAY